MSNPSARVYQIWKHALQHEIAYPRPLRFGVHGHGPLVIGDSIVRPFTEGTHELGLHAFFDANLGAPRKHEVSGQGAIAAGTKPTIDPPAMSKSITGAIIMLGGGPVLTLCLRQQLQAPESHTAEVTAGGTLLHRLIPLRGTLQECLIPQLRPTPVYTDSQSYNDLRGQLGSGGQTLSLVESPCQSTTRRSRHTRGHVREDWRPG